MSVTPEQVKKLREISGAPMMECKRALDEAQGEMEKAFTVLRKRGLATAAKKAGRTTSEGVVGSYIHAGGKIGVLVEVNCESDFVARTRSSSSWRTTLPCRSAPPTRALFARKTLPPRCCNAKRKCCVRKQRPREKPENVLDRIVEGKLGKFYEDNCLYEQHFIKDSGSALTVGELIASKIAKFGENIIISRFSRLKIGETAAKPEAETAPAATA